MVELLYKFMMAVELRLSGETDNLNWTIGAYTFEEDNYGIIDVPVLRGYTPPAPTAWPMYLSLIHI